MNKDCEIKILYTSSGTLISTCSLSAKLGTIAFFFENKTAIEYCAAYQTNENRSESNIFLLEEHYTKIREEPIAALLFLSQVCSMNQKLF